jgi:hypothetical protein
MNRVEKILETIRHSLDTLGAIKVQYEGKKKGAIYSNTVEHHTKKLRKQKQMLNNLWDIPVRKYTGVILTEENVKRRFEVILANLTDEEFIKLIRYQTRSTLISFNSKPLESGKLKFLD